MVHKIIIWSKSKETGKSVRIEHHFELTQEEVEVLAIQKYKEDYTIDDEREYWAEIDETRH